MIQEAYCSFEVSKILKEKGFEGDINAYYHIWDNGNKVCSIQEFSNSEASHLYIPAPTLQIAMKWLREVHNLFIEIRVGEIEGRTWYDFDIIPINGREIDWDHYTNLPFVELNSYEEAVEVALKYVLENLI